MEKIGPGLLPSSRHWKATETQPCTENPVTLSGREAGSVADAGPRKQNGTY